jgi:hypothetical protein
MIITGWFTRVVVALAILGVLAFDGLSVVSAHFGTSDDAQAAALAAASVSKQSGVNGAAAAAQQSLSRGETIVPGSLQVAADGTVSLRVRRTARSLVLRLLPRTRNWAVVTEAGSGAPPS